MTKHSVYSVYVAEYGNKEKRTKVGISTNTKNRLRTAQSFTPDIKLKYKRNFSSFDQAKLVEDKVKKSLKKYAVVKRLSCEVFKINSAIVINAVKKIK